MAGRFRQHAAKLGVLQREVKDRPQITRLVPGVVAHPVELDREDGALRQEPAQPVGELDLASLTPAGLLQGGIDVGSEQVPADDREVRRRFFRGRLLDEIGDPVDAAAQRVARNDAVAAHRLARHPLHEQDRTVDLGVRGQHLPERGRVGVDDVVAQHHRERLVADPLAADEHRVAEAEGLGLAGRRQLDARRELAEPGEQGRLPAPGEHGVEGRVRGEVVLEHPLAGAVHEDDVRQARRGRLLDAVLDDRLVDDGQQLLGEHRGGGQDARAEPGGGKHGLANRAGGRHRGA